MTKRQMRWTAFILTYSITVLMLVLFTMSYKRPISYDEYYMNCVWAGGDHVQQSPRQCFDFNGNEITIER